MPTRKTGHLSARIRAPLRKGGERRHGEVPDDDPDRQRLVAVVSLRGQDPGAFAIECRKYVMDNLGLAVAYARALDAKNVPEADLINAAVIGLLEAIRRFDVTKAGRFSTFAVWRMKYECGKLIEDAEGHIVRVPGQLRDDQRAIEEAAKKLFTLLGTPPEDEQILAALRADEAAKERDLLRELSPGQKPPPSKWAHASAAQIRNTRESYSGVAHSQLDPRTPAEIGVDREQQADIARTVRELPLSLQAVIVDEYDLILDGVSDECACHHAKADHARRIGSCMDDDCLCQVFVPIEIVLPPVPSCPVAREAALNLAKSKLRRKLS